MHELRVHVDLLKKNNCKNFSSYCRFIYTFSWSHRYRNDLDFYNFKNFVIELETMGQTMNCEKCMSLIETEPLHQILFQNLHLLRILLDESDASIKLHCFQLIVHSLCITIMTKVYHWIIIALRWMKLDLWTILGSNLWRSKISRNGTIKCIWSNETILISTPYASDYKVQIDKVKYWKKIASNY